MTLVLLIVTSVYYFSFPAYYFCGNSDTILVILTAIKKCGVNIIKLKKNFQRHVQK